jgi:hypothetical protein
VLFFEELAALEIAVKDFNTIKFHPGYCVIADFG